jgi:hypothetical protein
MPPRTQPPRRNSRSGAPAPGTPAQTVGIRPMGTIRRSQLVSTYAIGAILDLEDGSCMPSGLEDWGYSAKMPFLRVHEPRLEAQLGVRHFLAPPVLEEIPNTQGRVDPRKTVAAIRFPRWHECRKCHRIGIESFPFEVLENKLRCEPCGMFVNPVRFVTACRKGHIDDFPWAWWAHRRKGGDVCSNSVLFLRSMGNSAALADLFVECRTCGAKAGMADAFGAKTFENRLPCSGRRPWLRDREQGCTETQRTLQRGASNVHFTVQATALSIPPTSGPEFQIVTQLMPLLEGISGNSQTVHDILKGYADTQKVDLSRLVMAWESLSVQSSGDGLYTDLVARAEEYHALSTTIKEAPSGGFLPNFENDVYQPEGTLSKWFDAIGAVSRLREVRVLAGFSRIEPYPVSGEKILEALKDGKVSPLSKSTNPDWLPAAEIRGEGIFLRFREDAVAGWIGASPNAVDRARSLEAISAGIAAQRGYTRDYFITPRLLLIHSFAHAFIRQLSLECGYSAASIRERLYVAETTDNQVGMSGVLVYTGSPDSDGSLGGLVRLAREPLLERIVLRTMDSVCWCGSDPVCLETAPAQSGERVGGAACHSCLLLPETSCEKFNRELDRTMLVGGADDAWQGFFVPAS